MQEDTENNRLTEINIGNTPLRKCAHLSVRFNTNIYVKEEFYNQGKSSKDRPALFMIQDAIAKNKITKGGYFVEASSGNTGLGVVLIAKQLGYKAKIFVSKSCSNEKIEALKTAGASIEMCENSNGLHDFYSTQFRAQSFAATNPNSYFTNQYYNSQNIRAHYKTTGPELWEQTNESITHFIAGIGTGGTISGVGRYLKEKNKHIKIWGVEPNGSILQYFLKHRRTPENPEAFDSIEGIGRNFIPGAFDADYVDEIFQIGSRETKHIALEYYEQTDILVGYSSAALIASIEQHLTKMNFKPTDQVVLLFPDHGSRYKSKLYKKLLKTTNNTKNTF
ncbi:PLP-dependent cysteine synthase family protein [Sphingobacterium sp. JB170]|uniref:PLP-dependent cysteine synthase family protein n=1 Tax=Sphingobacterium sp. JB170 TaxID=1434842 RepID=UPI00097ED849|nr:cysteine synthase family protein [Sphingobacterium sp. JB170]SJN44004.1 Cystathionine beta-synthase [Sphingobacterium sp. JB170]